jgi:hypothetical protein
LWGGGFKKRIYPLSSLAKNTFNPFPTFSRKELCQFLFLACHVREGEAFWFE